MAEKAKDGFTVVVVGATGAVGKEALNILFERGFPIGELRAVASSRSKDQTVEFGKKMLPVDPLTPEVFQGADFAFFTAGSTVSREWVPIAVKAGAWVVDNTSSFRMEKDVPLVIPEVNGYLLGELPPRGVIANPNCAAIQIVMALASLQKNVGISRVVVSTYQSTSGAGRKAMDELSSQVMDLFGCREIKTEVFSKRIAFNLLPLIGVLNSKGDSGEEEKICEEMKKIFADDSLGVTATAVRVPTFHGHAASINVELKKETSLDQVRTWIGESEGVALLDNPNTESYPDLIDVVGKDDVYVGRIREDGSRSHCFNLWVVGDNLRKGAALNGIQIMERLAPTVLSPKGS